MEHDANWALEGDGLVENLFYYLWCKDEFGGGPSLLIPDTIVYKFTQPAYWYFTSKSGKVKKKSKASLANVQIEKEFCRKLCGIDIVAYYLYMENDTPTIEYFNVDGLKDFLYNRPKIHNGVLQRFIVSKGASNYPVRGSILPGDIQYVCEQVVDHVMEVSFHKYRISRMVLHLKTDADDRVWLLWSSSIRLAHGPNDEHKPIDITYDAQVPAFVHLSSMPDGKPTKKNVTAVKCTSCAQSIDETRVLQTNYKAVIEHFKQLLGHMKSTLSKPNQVILWPPDDEIIQAAGGVGFGILDEMDTNGVLTETDLTIPPVLQFLHPQMSVQDFNRFVCDPVFLYKTAPMCENCYLVYADYSTSALDVNTMREHAPAILRPKRQELSCKPQEKVKRSETEWLPPPLVKPKAKFKAIKTQYPFNNPPTLPQRIDHTMLSDMEQNLPIEIKRHEQKYMPEEWKSKPTMVANPNSLSENLVKNEDNFFADLTSAALASNEYHRPLQHMIESASRLESIKANVLGKVKKTKRNPYAVVQKLKDDTSPRTKQPVVRKVEFPSVAPSTEEHVTSLKHREFLLKALREVQSQVPFMPAQVNALIRIA